MGKEDILVSRLINRLPDIHAKIVYLYCYSIRISYSLTAILSSASLLGKMRRKRRAMADNSRTPFAHWLSTAMKGRRISDTKLGAHVGVSATAIIRWRNGDAVPRDVAMIDSLADLFEEERAHVRRLAGRGELKDDAGGLESKWAELAFMAQAIENRLKMGLMREYFYDLMKRKFHEGVSEMEATTGLVLGLAEITDLAEALAKAFDEKE